MSTTLIKTNPDTQDECAWRIWYATCPGTTPIKVTAQTPSAAAFANGLVTLTFAAAHQLLAGDVVTVTGFPEVGYNGTYILDSVPTTTTATYKPVPGVVPALTGTVAGTVCDVSLSFLQCWCVGRRSGRVANTGTVYLGPAAADNQQTIDVALSAKLLLEAPVGRKLDLNKLYLDAATAGDGLTFITIR